MINTHCVMIHTDFFRLNKNEKKLIDDCLQIICSFFYLKRWPANWAYCHDSKIIQTDQCLRNKWVVFRINRWLKRFQVWEFADLGCRHLAMLFWRCIVARDLDGSLVEIFSIFCKVFFLRFFKAERASISFALSTNNCELQWHQSLLWRPS